MTECECIKTEKVFFFKRIYIDVDAMKKGANHIRVSDQPHALYQVRSLKTLVYLLFNPIFKKQKNKYPDSEKPFIIIHNYALYL